MVPRSIPDTTYVTNTAPSDISSDAYQRRMKKQKAVPSSMTADPSTPGSTLDGTSNVSNMRQKIGY